jgi:predicted small metal-binding protein
MAKLFTCERVGFGMRAESDDELAAHVERHMAQAHADLAGRLAALPDDWRSYFAKRLAADSTTATT